MAADLFLDDDEVAGLCWPVERKSARCAWLAELGVPHFVRPNGTPCVVRSAIEALITPDCIPPQWAPQAFAPAPAPRAYGGSALQRYHDRMRVAAAEHDAAAAADRAAWNAQQRAMAPMLARQRREQRAALVRFNAGKRRAARLRRTPAWADLGAIKAVYVEARRRTVETGISHHVDHEIPLQGELVSGLHVHNNLQILTGSENSRKKNRFEVFDG
jgi:hypothetical protein